MRKVYELIKWFLYITPGIVFVYAVNIEISGDTVIPAKRLWQILLSGFLTALITTLLVPRKENKKLTIFVEGLLHYTVLSIIIISCGCWFGWISFDIAEIVMLLVSVAVVYLMVFFVYYLIDVKQAKEINQKLKEKYGDKE